MTDSEQKTSSAPEKPRRRGLWLDRLVLSPIVPGIILMTVGVSLESRWLILAGWLGIIPLGLVFALGFVGLVLSPLDDALPEFRGKGWLFGALAVLLLALLISFGVGREGNDSGSCPSYRGVPTCE